MKSKRTMCVAHTLQNRYVHADPNVAPSDGPNMIKLDDMEKVIRNIKAYNDIKTIN